LKGWSFWSLRFFPHFFLKVLVIASREWTCMCRFWVHPSNWWVQFSCFEVYPSTCWVSSQKYECGVTNLIMPLYDFVFFGVEHNCLFVSQGFISLCNVKNNSYD
jgi:hypothetical protein